MSNKVRPVITDPQMRPSGYRGARKPKVEPVDEEPQDEMEEEKTQGFADFLYEKRYIIAFIIVLVILIILGWYLFYRKPVVVPPAPAPESPQQPVNNAPKFTAESTPRPPPKKPQTHKYDKQPNKEELMTQIGVRMQEKKDEPPAKVEEEKPADEIAEGPAEIQEINEDEIEIDRNAIADEAREEIEGEEDKTYSKCEAKLANGTYCKNSAYKDGYCRTHFKA